ncbi:MAG: hypothetical protein ACERKX_14955, partial [Anaerolineales bacterium]
MPLNLIMILISIPAALLSLVGFAWLTKRNKEERNRGWTLFLLGAAIMMTLPLAIFAARVRIGGIELILVLEIPALVSVLTLILLEIRKIYQCWQSERVLYSTLLTALVLLFGFMAAGDTSLPLILLVPALILAVAWWALQKLGWSMLASLGAVLVVILLLEATGAFDQHMVYTTPWLRLTVRFGGIFILIAALLISVLLIDRGLKAHNSGDMRHTYRNFIISGLICLGLALSTFRHGLMVNASGHASEDHMPAGIVGLAVVVGILLAFGLRQRRLGPGLAYMLLMPVVITLAYVSAWLVDPLTVTTNRVNRIDQAVERYHQEQGSYPSSLAQLMPDQLLFKLPPLTGRGQVWCYQGGVDYYRLGYAYYQRYYELGSLPSF